MPVPAQRQNESAAKDINCFYIKHICLYFFSQRLQVYSVLIQKAYHHRFTTFGIADGHRQGHYSISHICMTFYKTDLHPP